MKRIKNLLLLCVLLLLTGCVKFNASMDIKKDKSMDFTIIYAANTSLFGSGEDTGTILNDDEKSKLKEQGFEVVDYSEGSMKGFKIFKKIKNIDTVSTTEDTEYSLSGLTKNDSNVYVFKVKKGLLKNHYIAKLKFDSSDNDMKEETKEADEPLLSAEEPTDQSNDTILEENYNSNFDPSLITSSMDLSFNVNLPYSAISNNATSTSDNNKKLTWNLSLEHAETMDFEFELYNMKVIYMGIGAIVLIIAILFILILGKKKYGENTIEVSNNEQQSKVDENSSQVISSQPTEPVSTSNIGEMVPNVEPVVHESVSDVKPAQVINTNQMNTEEPILNTQNVPTINNSSSVQNEQSVINEQSSLEATQIININSSNASEHVENSQQNDNNSSV